MRCYLPSCFRCCAGRIRTDDLKGYEPCELPLLYRALAKSAGIEPALSVLETDGLPLHQDDASGLAGIEPAVRLRAASAYAVSPPALMFAGYSVVVCSHPRARTLAHYSLQVWGLVSGLIRGGSATFA